MGTACIAQGAQAQCSVVTWWVGWGWDGREIGEGRNLRVQTADSRPCTAEANATLQSNCASIKQTKKVCHKDYICCKAWDIYSFLNFIYFLIDGILLYNFMLVSAIQQYESVIILYIYIYTCIYMCIYIYIYIYVFSFEPPLPLLHPTPLGHHRAPYVI